MTTIVWDGQILATDSMLYSDDYGIHQAPVQKIFKIKCLSISSNTVWFAGAGDYQEILNYVNNEDHNKELHEECEGIMITKNAEAYYVSGKNITKFDGQMAIGNGAQFALGALSAGLDAKEAVKVAIKHDILSGGKTQSIITKV